jgi:hypothetical protein
MKRTAAIAATVSLLVATAASGAADFKVAESVNATLADRVVTMDTRLIEAEATITNLRERVELAEVEVRDALDVAAQAQAGATLASCITTAEGFRVRMVDGQRLLVDVPDRRATVWLAKVAPSCVER